MKNKNKKKKKRKKKRFIKEVGEVV